MNEIDTNLKAQRAQGGLGLLSHTISVQGLQKPIPKVLIQERRREEKNRGRRGRQRERGAVACCSGCYVWRGGEGKGGEGYLRCPRRGPKYP